ncbi:hypothetical protein RND81_10G237500 [Saponaria officinalis]|uniref:Uncharacterized protein n=1 Tax=Saponaria officinalis TaxID=3572 RepID=A0AAW1I661_SAPOF
MDTSSIEFMDTFLFSNPSTLSYTNPNQKPIIRSHILELINDFPTFEPCIDTFFHFDGTSTSLLNVSGLIYVSKFLSDVPIIIWINENYPVMAPMVFVVSNLDCPVHENHPFIDKSGVIAPTYLNWDQKSNLCTLVHNLGNLFLHDHPSMPSSIFKVTVLDDLVTKVCIDVAMMNAQNSDEIEKWSSTQEKLRTRADQVDGGISSLLIERENLEKRVIQLRRYTNTLSKWLRRNRGSIIDQVDELTYEDVFEEIDEKSKAVLDTLADDRALDDVMYGLDTALIEGVTSFKEYIRQVRVISREQFHCRAMLVKLQIHVF